MFLLSPFEQFRLISILQIDDFYISVSVLVLLMILSIFYLMSDFLYFKSGEVSILNYILKELYSFIYGTVKNFIGHYTNNYFSFFFYIFFFIILSNILGLLPYSIALTSQLLITLSLSLITWISILYIGIENWGIKFFNIFLPHGISSYLVFFLVIIESISYIFRIFSLALRLFANIVAGHILLDCIIYFIYNIVYNNINNTSIELMGIVLVVIPFIFLIVLYLFEFVVAFLQAYIFVTLSALYLKEVL
jgi:F-type H+-transporting ATPase subunit a